MAFPVVESVTPTTFASNTTAHAVNMPATCNAGDLKLVLFASDGSAAVTTPTGWTLLYSTASSSLARGSAYARVHAEGDPATVNFVTASGEQAAAQCFRISGWYGAVAGGVEARAAEVVSSAAPDPSIFSPSWGSADNLWISAAASSAAATLTSAPSGYSDTVSTISAASTAGAQQYSARKTATSGSDDPGAWVFSASQPNVFSTIAVRGAAGLALTPQTGSAYSNGPAPSLTEEKAVETGAAPTAGGIPARSVNLAAGRGAASTAGVNAPALTFGASAQRGHVSAGGGAPILAGQAEPARGGALASGSTPSLVYGAYLQPTAGRALAEGRQPSIGAAADIVPAAGVAAAQGQAPARSLSLLALTGEAGAIQSAASALSSQRTPAPGLALAGGASPSRAAAASPASAALVAISGAAPTASSVRGPGRGVIAAAGDTPAIALQSANAPAAGICSAAGASPDLVRATALSPSSGEASTVGASPALSMQAAIAPVVGDGRAEGQSPALAQTLRPGAGDAISAGNAPGLGEVAGLLPVAGGASATGSDGLTLAQILAPQPGGIFLQGAAGPSMVVTLRIPASGLLLWASGAPLFFQGAPVHVPSRSEILAALFALLSGLGVTALRNASLPAKVPASGLIIMRDGAADVADALIGGADRYRHDVIVEIYSAASQPEGAIYGIADAAASAVRANLGLRSMVDDVAVGAERIEAIAVDDGAPMVAGVLPVTLRYYMEVAA